MIDAHAHITFSKDENISSLMENAKKANIEAIINVCTDKASLERSFVLKKTYPNIYSAAATTPHDVTNDTFFPLVQTYAKEKKLIAIGETGLDYYYQHSPKDLQKKYFEKYLEVANTYSLPVIIHCRDAFLDLFAMTISYEKKVMLHCFTGTKEDAKKALDRNWYLSFSGIITFKNSLSLQEVVQYVPINHMFIETDSPYLAPQKYRGKKNEPAFLIEIAKKISILKKISVEEVIQKTAKNAKAFFALETT